MHVKVLTFRGDATAQLYACGACGTVYSPRIYACGELAAHRHAEAAAESCCAPRHCTDCGVEIEKYWTACSACREVNRLRRATVVDYTPMFSEPIYTEEVTRGGWGEGYYADVMDLLQWCEDEEITPPAFVFKTRPEVFKIDSEAVLENATEEMHEDAGDQIVDADEFHTFMEAWNAKQTCTTHYPDFGTVVVLDAPRFHALLEKPDAA